MIADESFLTNHEERVVFRRELIFQEEVLQMDAIRIQKSGLRVSFLLGVTMMLVAPGLVLSAGPKLEKSKLKVGISVPGAAFLPLYVAAEENLFQREGLEVELLIFKSGSDNTMALLSRSVDIIAGGFPESALTPRVQGVDVKMFYSMCNMPVYKWYGRPEIKSLKDAKGKKFVVSKIGSQSDFVTRWVVKKAGLDPEKDIQVIQGGGSMERLSALASGAVDVAALTEPASYIAEKQGYNMLLSLDQFVKGFPNEVYATSSEFLRLNPETIKAILRANNKAIEFLRTHQDRSVAALRKHTKMTEEHAIQGYLNLRDSFPIDGSPPLDGIDLVQEIAIMAGEIKSKLPLTDLIDYTYINFFKK